MRSAADYSLLAAAPSGLLNVQRLAGQLGVSAPTARSYLEILETIHLVRLVPNDDMALGAVDALLCTDGRPGPETVVVGVDGTPQARAQIGSGPTPLRATVVQDSYRVAENAV